MGPVSSLAAPGEKVKDKQVTALNFMGLKKLQKALAETAKLKSVKSLTINFCWTGARDLTKSEIDKLITISTLEELAAGWCGDNETKGYRKPQCGHLTQVSALAAQ